MPSKALFFISVLRKVSFLEAAFAAWRDSSPANFVFALKVNRFITHIKRLKNTEDAVEKFITRARILGEKAARQGSLVVGTAVDMTIIDPNREWTVDVTEFTSRGKNTPLDGGRLKGKVMATLPRGTLAYLDESLKLERNVAPRQAQKEC